jgi:hypothetical protein
VLFVCSAAKLSALDVVDGRIRLVINEKFGRFAIYYKTDPDKEKYTPLIWDRNQLRTSFLSVLIENKMYKLGDTSYFKVHLRGTQDRPVLAFESPLVSVTETFSFIRTATSTETNAIRVDVAVENWSGNAANIGVRALIDTYLGEKSTPHFSTDVRGIADETLINRTTLEQWWVSKNKTVGLMGSIFLSGIYLPDTLYFANWKRLSGSKWKPDFQAGRTFNQLPFSIKDSAVCYYLEQSLLQKFETRTMTILLGAEDRYGFENPKIAPLYETPMPRVQQPNLAITVVPGQQTPPVQASTPAVTTQVVTTPNNNTNQNSGAPAYQYPPMFMQMYQAPPQPAIINNSLRTDLLTLRELIAKVDEYVYYNATLGESEIKAMENMINILRSRYGGVLTRVPPRR